MPREKKLMRSKISNYPVARLGYGVALYRKNSAKALAEPDFGWDGVIRTHAYRSQSPRPYRLATSQYERLIYNSTKKYKNLVKIKFFYGIFQKG